MRSRPRSGPPGKRRGDRGQAPDRSGGRRGDRRTAAATGRRGDDRGAAPSRPRRPPPVKAVIWKPGANARTVGAEAGMDLAHYIALAPPSAMSIRAIRRALDTGCCRVNGQVESFGSRIVKRGDVVEFNPPGRRPLDHDFDPRRLVHDSSEFIAYDKPAGLPVTPDDQGRKWNLRDLLRRELGFLIVVHRLDADTSGVVVMARTAKAARVLEDAFREHRAQKTYLAIVRGHPIPSGTYRSYLVRQDLRDGREAQPGQERWVSGRGADAREAVTSWTVDERLGPYASRVHVSPQTGRHHQIRLHFAEMGHPIYGDRQYGDRQDPIATPRHLLHAWKLTIPDPADPTKTVTVRTPVPEEFAEAERKLGRL